MWYQNICSASFSFVTIHACDRQTHRITTSKTALAYARAVKSIVHYSIRLQKWGTELIPVSWQSACRLLSHKPGGRILLFSTRPAVTFPAKEITHVGQYQIILLGDRHIGVSSLPQATMPSQPRLEPVTCESRVRCPANSTTVSPMTA